MLTGETGLPADVLELAVSRFSYGTRPVSAGVLAEQQRIADAFHSLKLIPRPVKVADARWDVPQQQAKR